MIVRVAEVDGHGGSRSVAINLDDIRSSDKPRHKSLPE